MPKKNIEQFIKEAKEVHGEKYDYSLVDYKNCHTKVKIICKEHGLFEMTPSVHIHDKCGCAICGKLKQIKSQTGTLEEFVKKARKVHGDKYDYSKSVYITARKPIEIICKEHGSFFQTPDNHTRGQGCPKCKNKKFEIIYLKSKEQFIEDAKKTHGDKYDYSLVDYKNSKTKVKIICPRHGEFLQIPSSHIKRQGCPMCKNSFGEEKIYNFLSKNGLKLGKDFFREYSFEDLKVKRKLRYDFYIPSKRLLIEYNGKQHYEIYKNWDTRKTFLLRKHYDWLKRKYANKYNIKLLTIPYWELSSINSVLEKALI